MTDKVAILGTGLVGSAWAIVFARAGRTVSLFDAEAVQAEQALTRVAGNMRELFGYGLIDDADAALARMTVADSLADALDGAAYAQESVFERADVKTEFYAKIDQVAGADVVIGSSSSGIPASVFTEGLACAP
ncbi:MAG: 3-hydroxyacyl-CoA dehydrogenase, partial [Rhodospirillaceae bacterium]|nr:3-hydroxyacyl-CoA dehydrogenase [Rhodospirillaceae bacterium]